MEIEKSHRQYTLTLAIAFGLIWGLLGLSPYNRGDWALENILVLLLALGIACSYRHFRFSPTSCTLIFMFLCIHEVGAHYTYSRVPYDDWWQVLTGRTLNDAMGWQRNHFDRLVHLCYGLMLAYPAREVLVHAARVGGIWSYLLALNFVLSSSALYELFEWVGGEYFGGDESAAFVGAQDDIWDAQKDMALAAFGALVALLFIAWRHYRRQPEGKTGPGKQAPEAP